MKLQRLFVAAGLVALAGAVAWRYLTAHQPAALQAKHEMPETDDTEQPLTEQDSVTLSTSVGAIRLVPASGYYGGRAIFVFGPSDMGFSQPLADAFAEATNGQFHMNRAPGDSMGGNSAADAIISAGLDRDAYVHGVQGYWKNSPPPRLNEVAQILQDVIARQAREQSNS